MFAAIFEMMDSFGDFKALLPINHHLGGGEGTQWVRWRERGCTEVSLVGGWCQGQEKDTEKPRKLQSQVVSGDREGTCKSRSAVSMRE